MNKFILSSLAALTLFASSAFVGALEDLRGAWSLTKTKEAGETITQSLKISKGKFIFRMSDADKKTCLFAQGDVKVETFNSLNSISFVEIQAGTSADDLKPVDDDRHCIYFLEGDTLTLALDFDRNRGKTPRTEVYTKAPK